MSLCSKPGCTGAAAAVLGYEYAARVATLEDPDGGVVPPHLYVLCESCAGKLRPPKGWTLLDRRATPPLFLDRERAARAQQPEQPAEAAAPTEPGRQLFFGHSA